MNLTVPVRLGDAELEAECHCVPHRAARISGPPEDCSPEEGGVTVESVYYAIDPEADLWPYLNADARRLIQQQVEEFEFAS